MAVLEIQDLLKPIEGNNAVGDDIRYDEDFLCIRDKRAYQEDRSLGAWKEKKSIDTQPVKSVEDLCIQILKTKSKDIQVLSFLMEDRIKKNNLLGLQESLELLINFCEKFWLTCHPIVEKNDFIESRKKIFLWMDEKFSFALRQSFILFSIFNLEISFDDIEKVNKLGIYSKTKSLQEIPPETNSKYQFFLKKCNHENIHSKIIPLLVSCQEKIKLLETKLKETMDLENNFFSNLLFLLNELTHFFQGLVKVEIKKDSPSEDNLTQNSAYISSENKENNEQNNFEDRNVIYKKIEDLGKNLLALDPHSPVPHFLFKLLTWKDKSFLEIVPELGFNSPLFEFLNTKHKNSGADEEGGGRSGRGSSRRRMIDPDDEDDDL